MNLETISLQRGMLWLVVIVAPIIALTLTVERAGWGFGFMWLLCWAAYPLRHHRVFEDEGEAPHLTDADLDVLLGRS